jgi:hypothetical protein
MNSPDGRNTRRQYSKSSEQNTADGQNAVALALSLAKDCLRTAKDGFDF